MIKKSLYLWLTLAFTLSAYAENRGILTEITVPPHVDYWVVDSLDGVEARYRTMSHSDYYGEYSCAGYIKAYYETVYGVLVENLTDYGPPRGRLITQTDTPTADIFTQVEVPQRGDIIFYQSPPHRNNHSAIVKSFDGKLITLIEQNFKWAQDGGTYTWYNRTITYDQGNNPYQIWRLASIGEIPAVPHTTENLPPSPSPLPESTDMPEDVPSHTLSPAAVPADDIFVDHNEVIFEVVFGGQETLPVFFQEPGPTIEPEPVITNEVVVGIGNNYILINGVTMPISKPPYIANNRTMLPVRYVSYALGLGPDHLYWDETARSVTVFNKGDEIRFTIDSEVLFINGRPTAMDCMAVLTDGSAFLPVRFLAEAMNVSFEWDSETASVHFYTP